MSFFEPPEIPDEPEPYTPISPPEWIGHVAVDPAAPIGAAADRATTLWEEIIPPGDHPWAY